MKHTGPKEDREASRKVKCGDFCIICAMIESELSQRLRSKAVSRRQVVGRVSASAVMGVRARAFQLNVARFGHDAINLNCCFGSMSTAKRAKESILGNWIGSEGKEWMFVEDKVMECNCCKS